MFGVCELSFLLFSASEIMISAPIKPYIVGMIQKHGDENDAFTNRGPTPVESSDNGTVENGDSTSKKAAGYLMIDLVGTYLPCVVLGTCCGAWSDRHGRKLLLLLPPTGYVISALFYLALDICPDNLLAMVVLGSLVRQPSMFTMIIYSIVANITPRQLHSARFTALTGARYLGQSMGALGAGIIVDAVGVRFALLTSSALQVINVILIITAISEDTHRISNQELNRKTECEFVKYFMDTFCKNSKTSVAPKESREHVEETKGLLSEDVAEHKTIHVKRGCVLAGVFMIYFLTQSIWVSQREIIVQSVTVPPFSWPDSWYGYLTALYYGMTGLTLMLLVPCFNRLWKLHSNPNGVVLVLALVCGGTCSLWTALAIEEKSSWQIFCAYILGAIGPASNASLRVMASQSVASSDQGKVNAGMTMMENLAKLLGPLYHTAIYVATLHISHSFVYFVMLAEAVILGPAVLWHAKHFKNFADRLPELEI